MQCQQIECPNLKRKKKFWREFCEIFLQALHFLRRMLKQPWLIAVVLFIIDPIMLILVWIKKADNSHWELYDRVWAHAQTISNLFYLWKREKTVFSWNKTLNQPSSANLKNRFFCWVLLQISCFFPFFSFLPLSNPLWSLFPFQMSICYNYPIRTY